MIRIASVLHFVTVAALAVRALSAATEVAAQQPQRRDSAGITIVTYAPGQLTALPRRSADPTPVFSIGAVDGPPGTILDDVAVVLSSRDGGVVIADNDGTVIRRYDSTGRYLGSSGREGEGPGEFRRIVGLSWLPSDSLIAYERFSRRVTVLDPQLSFARTLTLPESIELEGPFNHIGGASYIHGLGGHDAVALATRPEDIRRPMPPGTAPAEPATVVRGNARLVLLRPTTAPAATQAIQLRLVPGPTAQRGRTESGGTWSSNVQFGADPFVGGNQTGFFYADGARLEVLGFHPDGRLRSIFRVNVQPRAVTAAERAERERSMQPVLQRVAERRGDAPRPVAIADRYPLITHALLDAAGNVWLELDEPFAAGRGWLVVGADGAPRFWHAAFPETPRYIGTDHMLAITRDELGVQRVVKYRLGR